MPVEAVAPQFAPYAEAFERAPRDEAKRAAFDQFLVTGFPSARDEDWKFTNLSALIKTPFEPAEAGDAAAAAKILEQFPAEKNRIVFLNGRRLTPAEPRDTAASHLGQYADRKKTFVALNAAFSSDTAVVHVHGSLAEPVHVIHIFLPGARPQMAHPRNLFVFDAGAQGSVIETYVGQGEYFHNAVTEIVLGEGAIVEHVKLQRESTAAFHISSVAIQQARGSVFTSRSFALGGALARTEINAVLDEGSECTLHGLYVVKGKQHVDTRTVIDHAKPHAASHEVYKGILDGKSSAVFNGKIIVRKDAQKTDAKQTNKNLVLSEDATINTKPQLEIFADDVKCTHGATVGQLDADSMFYLRSRGIGAEQARSMLIDAFAHEVVDGIKEQAFREYVGQLV
jgi:Fe-S cluster assembly protein SufD